MIFQFTTKNVTFFEEDQAYYEKRFTPLKKMLGSLAGDEDTVDVKINVEKSKEKSGDKYTAKVHMIAPRGGDFYAEVSTDAIKKCADELKDILKNQIQKFHEKHS